MEKRTVRIYKAPDGKGRYINKTSQFLHRAQEGAQVDNGMDQYVQYIQSELQNQTDPQEIYQNLVEAGLPEENAQSLIQQIMQGISQPEETEHAQYQDGGEQEVLDQYATLTDQGQEDPKSYSVDAMVENTPGTQTFQFPGLDQYIPSYNPVGWDESNVDAYGNATFEKGGNKKSFAKNVLNYLKKQQEGGEGDAAEVDPNQPLGRGNLQDTDTDTVSKRKSDFLATLKNQADTAKTEELHGKMMQSGDPSLMQIANTLGQGEKAQPIPFAPVAQEGGFTGGQDPMDYFQDGGYDQQYAQDGTEVRKAKVNYVPRYTTVDGGLRNLIPWNRLVTSQDKYTRSNAYNVGDKSAYTGNMEGYRPIERRVTKTGIFGRPKEWTDIYSNVPQADPYSGDKLLTGAYPAPSEKNVKSKKDSKSEDWVDITGPDRGGMSDEEWDNTSFSAKRAIRKGDRQATRNERRYNKQLQKDEEFNKSINRFADLNKKEAEEKKQQKEKETATDMKRAEKWSTKMGMDDSAWWDNGTTETALPEGLSSEDIEMINTSNADRENMLKASATEKQRVLETYLNPNSQLLNNSDRGDFIDNWYIPTIQNAVKTREEFTPSSSMDDPGLNPYYRFPTGKSKAITKKEAEEEAMRMQMEQEGREAEYEKRYGGGLYKAQIGVKTPTNGLKQESDATASLGPVTPSPIPQSFQSLSGALNPYATYDPTSFSLNAEDIQPNWDEPGPVDETEKEDYNTIAVDNKRKKKYAFNGEEGVNVFNAGAEGVLGFINRRQQAKQNADFMDSTTNAYNVFAHSSDKDKGDYNENGSGIGMLRPDQTGNNTNGRFAFGQRGGYMQSGGFTEGDEVEMTEEELADFLANGGEVEYI